MKQKEERKRSISILTVLLWIALVSVMIVITINGIKSNENAIEEETVTTKEVKLQKNAEWVDKESGIAKVTLKESGEQDVITNDVVLVVDRSGSMTFLGTFWEFTDKYFEDPETGVSTLITTSNEPGKEYGNSPCTNSNHWINGKHYYDIDNITESQEQDLYDKEKGCTDRFDKVIDATNLFLEMFLDSRYDNRVAFAAFARNASDVCNYTSFTNDITKISNEDENNLGALQISRDHLTYGTNYTVGLDKARQYILKRNLTESGDQLINSKTTYIIFLSDGNPSPIENDGEEVAKYLKSLGVKIYSIGLSVNEDTYLRKIATYSENDEYLKLTNNAEELIPLYKELAVKIISAGTDAYITDVISDDFEYYEDETHKPTEGTILLPPDSEDGKTIKWYQKEVAPEETTYEFYIKVKDGEEHENGNWPTNESADVTYKNKEGKEEIVTVESPVLGRHRYDVEHYLEQEDGSYKLEEKETYLVEEGEKVVAKTNIYETYTFNKDVEGTVLEGIIEETGRVVLKLYYDKIESNVIVRYVDKNGIDIADKIELIGKVGGAYTTERKEIKGYVSY